MGSIIKNSLFERKAFIVQPHSKFKTLSILFKIIHHFNDEISLSLIVTLKELMIPYKSTIRGLQGINGKLAHWLIRHPILGVLIILYKRLTRSLKHLLL